MVKIIQALSILALLLLISLLTKNLLMGDYSKSTKDDGTFFQHMRNNTLNKVELKRIGADGINYYFSMSDTIPTFPSNIREFFSSDDYTPTFKGFKRRNAPFSNPNFSGNENLPHISFFQGDPLHLHGVVTLENASVTGDDSLMAVIGLVDGCGNTNNVFKATPSGIHIQTTLYHDSTGGANYDFTKDGITFSRSGLFTYNLVNRVGKAGQVLMMNTSTDSAKWEYVIENIEKTGLPVFKSVELAKKAKLKSGDAFILDTNLGGAPIKILAFIP